MGFWKKLGKVALKAAPIAAAFIPGVGPLASMAIGGLTSAADSKLSGGSWKNALLSGGIGAGMGYAGGKIKGIGPSSKVVNAAGKTGQAAKGVSRFASGLNTANKIANIAGSVAPIVSSVRGGDGGSREDYSSPIAPTVRRGQQRPEMSGFANRMYDQLGPVMGASDQSSPNLAFALGQGRMETLQNQPFRSGYQVNAIGRDDVPFTYQQGPIYPQYENQPGPEEPVWKRKKNEPTESVEA